MIETLTPSEFYALQGVALVLMLITLLPRPEYFDRFESWIRGLWGIRHILAPEIPWKRDLSTRRGKIKDLLMFILFLSVVISFLLPYFLFEMMRNINALFHAVIRRDEAGQPTAIDMNKLHDHYYAGKKLSEGGKKGARVKQREGATSTRDDSIRSEAEQLLATGRSFHELAGILARRYSGKPGYPTSNAQYRNIIRPLRKKNIIYNNIYRII